MTGQETLRQETLRQETLRHCRQVMIPYWTKLIDRKHGGYYGCVDFNLHIEEKSDKGVILNSRILYFFSKAVKVLGEGGLLEYADWAYEFLTQKCIDRENGGVYWMLFYDGNVKESMKHTYNQAFAIYALSAYYEATGKEEAKELALDLFHLVEEKCADEDGWQEAFTKDWIPVENEKLSENGVSAERTMNTLLHLVEGYSLLYQVSQNEKVAQRLACLLRIFEQKVWNEEAGRLEVFFDAQMHSLTDLYSYGHDIEASWLIDYAYTVLGIGKKPEYTTRIADNIYERALEGGSVNNECFHGKVNRTKVWWVQAEAVIGFYHAWQKTKDGKYLKASEQIWQYIKEHFIDARSGSEWFWDLDETGYPKSKKPLTEPWKCPYHNGRMCMELYVRGRETDGLFGEELSDAGNI